MVRFGVVGTNFITDQLLDSVKELTDFSLTAVYSRTEERAKEYAAKYGVNTIFTNLEDMAKSEEIDAVYIASPNSFHASQSILFLQNGKHVLCEKPLASNVHEVEAMQSAARENHVVLMEAMKPTLMPTFKSIQENLHKIGKVRRFFGNYCQYSSRYDSFKRGTVLNAFNPTFSNGALMDLGVYCIYPMVVLFGMPEEIKASAIMLSSGVDGQGSAVFQFKELEAVIQYSKITNSYSPSEIQGEEGSIIIDKISTPEKVEIRYRDGRIEPISIPQVHQPMYYEVEEFVNLIKTGQTESKINSFQHSWMTSQICDAIRKQIGLIYPADQQG
ncbi:Gfo/Idh/MocA family protein [Neobacillus sp. D3-1R]|uniref:Gfo/Idh/MocA family protein n=1 Tax=Neobacillus sp. D3-1R TaxID=3445778 RepID=UPI003F9F4F59